MHPMIDHTKLIGRRGELAALQNAFAGIEDNKGRIIFLSGEAGVGKTLLAENSLAQSGLKIYTGRATEEVTPPYGPIAAALRDCLREMPRRKFDCGPLTPYLALLLPELGDPPKDPSRDTIVEAISAALSGITSRAPSAIFLATQFCGT